MEGPDTYVIFYLDEKKFALPLSEVERIVPAAGVTPLPKAPEHIAGLFNLQGRIFPAVNMRRRLGLPEREMDLSDKFVIACGDGRNLALLVDQVEGVVSFAREEVFETELVLPGAGSVDWIEAVLKWEGDVVPVIGAGKILSPAEETLLDELEQGREEGGHDRQDHK